MRQSSKYKENLLGSDKADSVSEGTEFKHKQCIKVNAEFLSDLTKLNREQDKKKKSECILE